MKSLIIVPLVALSALSPVDAAPSIKIFSTSNCTGDPSGTVARPAVGACSEDASAGTSEKTLAIEEGVTLGFYEVRLDAAGNPRGNCDGAANMTSYAVLGKCEFSDGGYEILVPDVAAGTFVTKKECNADCSVCAAQDPKISFGDCLGGYITPAYFATGSLWPTSQHSGTGCEASNMTGVENPVCNACLTLSTEVSVLWDCETAGPVNTTASGSSSAAFSTMVSGSQASTMASGSQASTTASGSSTQFAVGLLFALLVLLLTAF